METRTSQTLRLHVWGSNPSLPTLDPTSLYAASLLLATFERSESVEIQLTSASTSLTERVPLLQVVETDSQEDASGSTGSALTTALLNDVDAIREFCAAAGLDADLTRSSEKAARALALHAMLDDQLLDLVLHSLFSFPANYRTVTAASYSSIGSSLSPTQMGKSFRVPFTGSSIPSRLRNSVQQRLTAIGIWGIGGSESTAQAQESHEFANRAGLVPPTKSKLSFGSAAKDVVKEEFERTKLSRRMYDVLAVLESCAEPSDRALLEGDTINSLDAHAFSLLAPLLYSTPALPVQLVSRTTMSTSFPNLLARLDMLRQRLWPAETSAWPSWVSAQDGEPDFSSWWPFPGIIRNLKLTAPRQQQDASEKASSSHYTRPTRSRTSTPESRRLRWGRILWITTALVGLVGYTFASGLVSVEWISEDDADTPHHEEEEEEETQAEEEAEEEAGEEEEHSGNGGEEEESSPEAVSAAVLPALEEFNMTQDVEDLENMLGDADDTVSDDDDD